MPSESSKNILQPKIDLSNLRRAQTAEVHQRARPEIVLKGDQSPFPLFEGNRDFKQPSYEIVEVKSKKKGFKAMGKQCTIF
jgi:hypothetical protein